MSRLDDAVRRFARALPTAGSSPRALTAAGSPLVDAPGPTSSEFFTPEAFRQRKREWQQLVLQYVGSIPEVAGVGMQVQSTAGRIKLTVTAPDGESEAPDTAQAKELQRRLDQFDLGRATLLQFYVGENYIHSPARGDFDVLSIDEVNTRETPFQKRGLDDQMKAIPEGDQLMRVWRPDPGMRGQAYSPFKATIDLLKSMYSHQLADTSVAMSRLAGGGILVWPTSLERMGLDENGKPYAKSQEELLQHLHKAMSEGLKSTNRDAKAAWAPFVQFVDPGQSGDKVHMPELLRLDRDDQADMYEKRYREYAHRLAVAIDLPLEATEGMGSTNHWSGLAIRQDKIIEYVVPLAEINVQELRDRLAIPHGLNIKMDTSHLVMNPDLTEVFMQIASMRIATSKSIKDALMSGKVEDLVMVEPAQDDYTSNSRPTQPSDFKPGGDRGGGKYRDRA